MTVILSCCEDWQCPDPPVRCSCCGKRTMPPFVFWSAPARMFFFCAECSRWMRHGLTNDMIRVVALADGLARMADPRAALGT
jgi:hypothetical protein